MASNVLQLPIANTTWRFRDLKFHWNKRTEIPGKVTWQGNVCGTISRWREHRGCSLFPRPHLRLITRSLVVCDWEKENRWRLSWLLSKPRILIGWGEGDAGHVFLGVKNIALVFTRAEKNENSAFFIPAPKEFSFPSGRTEGGWAH